MIVGGKSTITSPPLSISTLSISVDINRRQTYRRLNLDCISSPYKSSMSNDKVNKNLIDNRLHNLSQCISL